MRALLLVPVVAVVLLVACTSVPASTEDRARWVILEREGTQRPEVVTAMQALPPLTTCRQFPILLQVSWRYSGLPNGMPSENELVYGRRLYQALDETVGKSGIYVMSRTGDGDRTIYYYVKDAGEVSGAIRNVFDGEPPLSVKVTVTDEPEWDTLRNVLSRAR